MERDENAQGNVARACRGSCWIVSLIFFLLTVSRSLRSSYQMRTSGTSAAAARHGKIVAGERSWCVHPRHYIMVMNTFNAITGAMRSAKETQLEARPAVSPIWLAGTSWASNVHACTPHCENGHLCRRYGCFVTLHDWRSAVKRSLGTTLDRKNILLKSYSKYIRLSGRQPLHMNS